VHRLVLAHPELAEELYDFFADVIEAEDHFDRPRPEFAESASRARDALRAALAKKQASKTQVRSRPFLALVRDARGGEFVDVIAASMQLPADFLVDASHHSTVLPLAARKELVRRAQGIHPATHIDEDEALASFDVSSRLRRAASRSAAYRPVEVTYRDIVERSSLSDEEKRFWLDLA
jgi:hypothetical protein